MKERRTERPARLLFATDTALALALLVIPLAVLWLKTLWTPERCPKGPDLEYWVLAAKSLKQLHIHNRLWGRLPLYPMLSALLSLGPLDLLGALTTVSALSLGATAAMMYLWCIHKTAEQGPLWLRRGAALGAGLSLLLGPGMLSTIGVDVSAAPLLSFLLLALVLGVSELSSASSLWPHAVLGTVLSLGLLTKPQIILLLPLCLHQSYKSRGPSGTASFLVGGLLPLALWVQISGSLGTLLAQPLIVLSDMFQRSHASSDNAWLNQLSREGLEVVFQTLSELLPRPAAMAALNLYRIPRALAPWLPLLAPSLLVLRLTKPSASQRVMVLASLSFLFALPTYWETRHMLPFLAPLLLQPGLRVPALWRDLSKRSRRRGAWGVAACGSLGALLLLPGPERQPKGQRCDADSAEIARALAQVAATFDTPPVLTNSHPDLHAYPSEMGFLGLRSDSLHPYFRPSSALKPGTYLVALSSALEDYPNTWDMYTSASLPKSAVLEYSELLLGSGAPLEIYSLDFDPESAALPQRSPKSAKPPAPEEQGPDPTKLTPAQLREGERLPSAVGAPAQSPSPPAPNPQRPGRRRTPSP